MITTRRTFLRTAALGLAPLAWPAWMPRMSFAPKHIAPRGDVLICIFLRGAADVLNVVVPHGEAEYYRLRPTLAIPRPDDRRTRADLRAIDLDGFFGMHPALSPLTLAWQDRRLAFVHACGAPDESRSHFQAMELMERGVAAVSGPASGWIGRHLASIDTGNMSPLRAIGLGERAQRSLQGAVPATALRSIADFHLGGDVQAVARMQATLAALYTPQTSEAWDTTQPQMRSGNQTSEASIDILRDVGRETLDVLATIEALDPAAYRPTGGAAYLETEFGIGLRQVAMLIKAEVGLEVACLDLGGWDTHIAQGGSEGLMAGLLADLGTGLAALYADLRDHADRLLVVTMSEFGRRVQENGGLGTDHGHGSLMMLIGGGVVGGKVHGQWPGLAPEQLVGPGDLAVTTDYRDVLGELIQKRLSNPNLGEVFPGYAPTFRGVVNPASPGREL
jgi:uncharacterized protein (DUF1501 family)